MKNVNVKLVLFYLVFMLGLKANAQVSKQDSIKYNKELSLDRATKVKFIQENDPKSYEKLINNINFSLLKYDNISDSLQNLAKRIVSEKTGDGDLVYSWDMLEPEKGNTKIDSIFYFKVKALLTESVEIENKKNDNVKNVINSEFVEFLKNNPKLSPFKVQEEQKKNKLFGKSR
ncbi:MAG: hypothetical protein JW974_01045 [Alphaproteobacteria bacterium]|nr:hypothetical protein [Alphaproteobacteria bacterium]MBN2675375.1 hypothetical protein [Alphaproteobacteria bacterium]